MIKQLITNIKYSRYFTSSMSFLLSGLLLSCSSGMRVRNLLNYPLPISSLEALDTLKMAPDVIDYSGNDPSQFREFNKSIRIRGKHKDRNTWQADERGCLSVSGGATVHISDFNFRGIGTDTSLIRVDSANLIIENCDFTNVENWAIEVGPQGYLELDNARFMNLGTGAIKQNGGRIKLFNSRFDMAGKTAISASKGKLFEVHKVSFANTMGTALELDSVNEVWMDSAWVIDSFQDGIVLGNCGFVLLNDVEVRENGRNGLHITNSTIGGLLNFKAIGNLVNGMLVDEVDTLRILNSEFIGNGENGAGINAITRARMAGIQVGHNGQKGINIAKGDELLIHHSSFQANPTIALNVDSVKVVHLENMSVVNNGDGVGVNGFDELKFRNNLLASNKRNAALFDSGNQLVSRLNLIKENENGLLVSNVLSVLLDSNRVESNTLGVDLRSTQNIVFTENYWISNKSGCYIFDVGSISSTNDNLDNNSLHGFEILSAGEFALSNATLSNNTDAVLLNQVSAKIETCVFDSGTGYALKLMNGYVDIQESKFRSNSTALKLAEGSRAKILQSQFEDAELAIDAGPSVSFGLSFSSIRKIRSGIRIGNYANVEILSNRFDEIDDYCISAEDPHLQSLTFRQNLVSQAGGILRSNSGSGKISIISNTFVNNTGGLKLKPGTLNMLDHNIFFNTKIYDFEIFTDSHSMRWNCFFPTEENDHPMELSSQNLYSNPHFDEQYYLTPDSPCLKGGDNGLTIGARGVHPEKRPALIP